MVETGISPPSSPSREQAPSTEEDHMDPLEEDANKNSLRVMAPQDINLNSDAGAKRPHDNSEDAGGAQYRVRTRARISLRIVGFFLKMEITKTYDKTKVGAFTKNMTHEVNKNTAGPAKRPRQMSKEAEMKPGVAENLQRFQSEMVDKFLTFQRESEVRFLAWEQERWRLEQTMLERWRAEQRNHDKEMFTMFCSLLSQCSQTILDNK